MTTMNDPNEDGEGTPMGRNAHRDDAGEPSPLIRDSIIPSGKASAENTMGVSSPPSLVDTRSFSVFRNFDHLFHSRAQHGTAAQSQMDDAFKKRVSLAKKDAKRLQVVCAAPLEELGCDYEAPVHAKSQEEIDFINDCFGVSFFFKRLGSKEKRTLVDAFAKHSVARGQTIIEQGEAGDYFYIIQKGVVRYVVDGTKMGKASRSDCFGALALLYASPRAATVTALTACELWRVDQITFRRIMATYHIKEDAETRELLRKVGFLKDLDDHALSKIACVMKTRDVKAGEHVVRKGEKYSRFVLVKSGKLLATGGEVEGKKLDDKEFLEGEHFGAMAMLKGLNVSGNIVAVEDSTVLYLEKSEFVRVCGGYDEMIRMTNVKSVLQTVPIVGRKLDAGTAGHLASLTVGMECEEGHVFYEEGDDVKPGKYIIHSGEVTVESSDGSTNTISPPEGFFGEEATGEAMEGTVTSKHTVTATEDVSLSYLDAWSIKSVLGANKVTDEIKMEDLEKHCILGVGTFGQVWLVHTEKCTKDVYALKIQAKRHLIDKKQAKNIVRERNIMAKLDSDFIIKLVNTYQDDQDLFMLLKLYQGGELWTVMHGGEDPLSESAAKFYAAGVLEGLTHMHHRDVLYRDLKPENVLLDSNGHTVIIDLGFAKESPDMTYTFCGTPPYMAPEVVLQRGHNKGADHWSWGVLLYEMICGITPFYEQGIDQMTLFKRIVNEEYSFPDGNFISKDAKDLIQNVLNANPTYRLGSLANEEKDIQKHAWFRGLDFEKLRKRELTPPWPPEVTDPLDVSCFDNWDHVLNEEKQEWKPLSVEEQAIFKDF